MEYLRRIVNQARLRMQWNRTLTKCSIPIFIVVVLVLCIAIVDRLGPMSHFPWTVIWVVSGLSVFSTVFFFFIQSNIPEVEAASSVDLKLQLHDRISTALAYENERTPFGTLVVENAIQVAQEQQSENKISDFFPIVFPKLYISTLILVGGIIATWWSPQWNWFNNLNNSSAPLVAASNEDIETSINALLDEFEKDDALQHSLEEELAELSAIHANEDLDNESMRREALKNITDVQKKLEELLQNEDALAFEEITRRLQALKMPNEPSMQPLVAEMKKGDFEKAEQEFKSLAERMESTQLSEEERDQLSESLKELANQFEKLSELNSELASALAASGMNGKLANNPDAAMKAIQNAKELSEEQKKKLLEMLNAQQQASEMCKKLGEGCKQCANGKRGSKIASELAKLKAMSQFKTKAQLAKMACQNSAMGMCKGGSELGKGQGSGLTGGKGTGNGGMNPTKETETTLIGERSPVESIEGTIIAKQLFEGGLLTTGESTAEIRDAVLAQQRDAEQAIIDEEVPRRYHDLLRHYFGQLEHLTEPSDEVNPDSN